MEFILGSPWQKSNTLSLWTRPSTISSLFLKQKFKHKFCHQIYTSIKKVGIIAHDDSESHRCFDSFLIINDFYFFLL